jgi:hypothetical protein
MQIQLNAAARLIEAADYHSWNNYPVAQLQEMLKEAQEDRGPTTSIQGMKTWKARNKQLVNDLKDRIQELKTGISTEDRNKTKRVRSMPKFGK